MPTAAIARRPALRRIQASVEAVRAFTASSLLVGPAAGRAAAYRIFRGVLPFALSVP
jgi:hypothetical protein